MRFACIEIGAAALFLSDTFGSSHCRPHARLCGAAGVALSAACHVTDCYACGMRHSYAARAVGRKSGPRY